MPVYLSFPMDDDHFHAITSIKDFLCDRHSARNVSNNMILERHKCETTSSCIKQDDWLKSILQLIVRILMWNVDLKNVSKSTIKLPSVRLERKRTPRRLPSIRRFENAILITRRKEQMYKGKYEMERYEKKAEKILSLIAITSDIQFQ